MKKQELTISDNTYANSINCKIPGTPVCVHIEPGLVMSADGRRFRQELNGQPSIADLVKPGDLVCLPDVGWVNAIRSRRIQSCVCSNPFCVNNAGEKCPFAEPSTPNCHIVSSWSMEFIRFGARSQNDGSHKTWSHGCVNHLVGIYGQVMFLSEERGDELAVIPAPKQKKTESKMQFSHYR
jgi:hypothetical protein